MGFCLLKRARCARGVSVLRFGLAVAGSRGFCGGDGWGGGWVIRGGGTLTVRGAVEGMRWVDGVGTSSVLYCACERNGSAGALCRAICSCNSGALLGVMGYLLEGVSS